MGVKDTATSDVLVSMWGPGSSDVGIFCARDLINYIINLRHYLILAVVGEASYAHYSP